MLKGSLYIPPHLHFKICTDKKLKDELTNLNVSELQKTINDKKDNITYHSIKIDSGIPFRTLTHPSPPSDVSRDSVMFYYCPGSKLPVSQEQVLRDSGYPEKNEMPSNFWGIKTSIINLLKYKIIFHIKNCICFHSL